jgi:acetate kinase
MRILVVNAGSSSLKLRLLDHDDDLLAAEDLPAAAGTVDADDLAARLNHIMASPGATIDAVGHRVVHGGKEFTGPVILTSEVVRRIEALTDLAPLHQPKSLAGIRALQKQLPDVPAVACFDTAFHATIPPAASTYALPEPWRSRYGLKRFGFHGISHAYASARAAQLLERPPRELRIVVCHLGAGASLCAVDGGRSVDTSMGFTPLEGLVMATRSGSVDPGLLLWLITEAGLTPQDVTHALEHDSGLLGLAGSASMQDVLEAAGRGERRAALAIDIYLHRLVAGIASMATAMGGLDALVFTGGVGENAPQIRARACDQLSFLGVSLDAAANEVGTPDSVVSSEGPVRVLLVAAREDLQIAADVRRALG